MIEKVLRKLFGSRNDRLLRQYQRQVRAINAIGPQIEKLTDAELRAKTDEFRARVQEAVAKVPDNADGDPEGAGALDAERVKARRDAVDDLLPEAFAVVREAGKRTLNMRHFDVQLIGGIALHSGKIAEMRTGEGKTLVATLPAYLNRRRLDGQDLPLPRFDCRGQPLADGAHAEATGVRCRHYLRHQQRVRIRLSPGQHGLSHLGEGAARAALRDCGRSRLDPD